MSYTRNWLRGGTLLSLLIACTAIGKPVFDYDSDLEAKLLARASDYLSAAQRADEETVISLEHEIQIKAGMARERRTILVYHPDQISAEESGSQTLYWDEEVEKLTVLAAGVVTEDSRLVRFKPSNHRVLDTDTYNTFTDQKKVVLAYSGVKANSVSVLVSEKVTKLSDLESGWSFSSFPVAFRPTDSFRLKVATDSEALAWHSTDPRVKCKGSGQQVLCAADNLSAYEYAENESWHDFIATVFVAMESDWQQVVNSSSAKFNSALLGSEQFDKLFSNIIEPLDTLEKKITSAQEFVSRDIRYVSMSELGHRITPHKVGSVIENRFGDCKDKSAVLTALLRRADINAYPVLIATERRVPDRFKTPSTHYFDHMIVCFEYQGDQRCIDATDSNTSWQAASSWISGKVGLPLIEKANLFRYAPQAIRWQAEYRSNFAFQDTGKQIEKTTRTYTNSYAGDIRRSYRAGTEQERQQWALEHYQRYISKSAEPAFEFEQIDGLSNELLIRSVAEYEAFLDEAGKSDYQERDHWMMFELDNSKLTNKVGVSEFEGLSIVTENHIDLGEKWEFRKLTPTLTIDAPFGTFTRKVKKVNSHTASISSQLMVPRRIVLAEDVEAFNGFLSLMSEQAMMNFKINVVQ